MSDMEKCQLALVLHAHLPFVRHPEYEQFLEEDWLFEAITETYLPLLSVMEGLREDRIDFQVTLSLSPTLLFMLRDPLLMDRYVKNLHRLKELSEKEVLRTSNAPQEKQVAQMYRARVQRALNDFLEKYDGNLVLAFDTVSASGNLELITCSATHGFLPLMAQSRSGVKAQIEIGCDQFEKNFGRRPKGIWLPECGYTPGMEDILGAAGIDYFFLDTHGLLHADPRPKYGAYAPIRTSSGVHAFCREVDASREVWSSQAGYPGAPEYRDFYRDIGFDLDLDYITPYIQPNGLRKMTGIKYHCITGGEQPGQKDIYDRTAALEKAMEHAKDFVGRRIARSVAVKEITGRTPLIVAPYDAELFGHWWFEGPEFLNFMFRTIAESDNIKTVTPSEYLKENSDNQPANPSASSWGEEGFSKVWLNKENDWIYRHLHKAVARMEMLAGDHDNNRDEIIERALNQSVRELLLAQSSDWAFIIKTGTSREYAERRTKEHLHRFNKLAEQIEQSSVDINYLDRIEKSDNLFSKIDFRVYIPKPVPVKSPA